jgi:two-component system sensor histidine kinase AlgZ
MMTKETRITLPDFRNLGILLRAALVVQLIGLFAALINARDLADALPQFLSDAAYLEPTLLSAMLILFLFAPKLAAMSAHWAAVACVAVSVFSALFWQILLQNQVSDMAASSLLRTVLLAGGVSSFILILFDWRARRLSPALVEARLQALQARIRPHFLFNSINSVLSLMRSNPAQAETALENLAELYRALMADNRRLSTLGREIGLARAYIELESLRLGERLQVDWRVDNAPPQALMPALMLQPLLENAVSHGIEPHPLGGRIDVDIFVRSGQLTLVVRNPSPANAPTRPGNRMALSNLRERLALHFDAEARLSARRVGDEFVVQMVMPLHLPGKPPL